MLQLSAEILQPSQELSSKSDPFYLFDIFHIDILLGQRHIAHDSQVQRVDDLRVWLHHTVVQHRIHVDVEEPGGQLSNAVPLPVHEEAAAVRVDQSADSLQDLEDHFLHVDIFLHVFDDVIHQLAFLNLEEEFLSRLFQNKS